MHTLRSVHSGCFDCSFTWKSGQYERLIFLQFFSQSAHCASGFFGSPRRRRVFRCRGLGGWRGRRVSLSGDLSPISLSDLHRHVVVVIHIAHQGTRLKQQQYTTHNTNTQTHTTQNTQHTTPPRRLSLLSWARVLSSQSCPDPCGRHGW